MARAPKITEAAKADRPAAPERLKRVKRNPELEAALGARIRAARIAAKMSQGALGEAVGISFQQVQKYELGKDRVAASTLQGIAATLGVHPGSFFDETMSVPVGSIPDVKAAFKAADALGQIRDPRILTKLLALAKALADSTGSVTDVESPAGIIDEPA